MIKKKYTNNQLWDKFGKKYPVRKLEQLFFKDKKYKDFEKFENNLFKEFKKTFK